MINPLYQYTQQLKVALAASTLTGNVDSWLTVLGLLLLLHGSVSHQCPVVSILVLPCLYLKNKF